MKRIISLIIALNFLCVSIPFGYAAFTDVEDSIAIDTVVGLGLMKGETDGTFSPDSNLTRGEFAQIISEIYTYDEENAAVTEWKQNFFEGIFDETELIPPEVMEEEALGLFEDVYTNNEYYDAIELVARRGIMVGTGDNFFDPDRNVTVEQALKVITNMMGYGYFAETMGGYPAGFNSVASQMGLTKNVGTLSGYATRKDIATILYNAFDVELMQLLFDNENGWVYDTVEDETFITKLLNIGYVTGRITNNGYTSLTAPLDDVKDYIVVNNKQYFIDADGEYVREYIGREAKVYYELDKEDNDKFVYANLTGKDEAITFDIDSFISYEDNTIRYFNEYDKEKTVDIKQAPFLMMNGSAKSTFTDSDFDFNYGTVTVITASDESQADIIILKSMVNFNVDYYDAAEKIIYSTNSLLGDSIDLDNEDGEKVIKVYNSLGELKDIQAISNGSITSVCVGEKVIEIHISDVEEAKFTVSSIDRNDNDETVISNGKTSYVISKDYTDGTGFSPRVGNSYDLKIDILGNVVYAKTVSAEYQIGFLNKASNYEDEDTGEEVVALRIFNMDLKNLTTFYVAPKVKVIDTEDNIRTYKMPEQANVIFSLTDNYIHEDIDNVRTRVGGLIRYKLDDEGYVSMIELAGTQENSMDSSDRLVEIKVNSKGTNSSMYNGSTLIGGKIILQRDTKILQCNYTTENFDTDKGYMIIDKSSFREGHTYDLKAYSLTKNSPVAKYAVYTSDPTLTISTAAPHTCGIVTDIEAGLNADDEPVTRLRLSNVEYETEAGILDEGNVTNMQGASFYTDGKGNRKYFKVELGDVIRYALNADGEISKVQLLYDANADYSNGVTIEDVIYEGWSKRGNLAGCIAGYDKTQYKFSNPFSANSTNSGNEFAADSHAWTYYNGHMRVMLGSVLRCGEGYLMTTTRNMSERPGTVVENEVYASNLFAVTNATVVTVGKKTVNISTAPLTSLKTYEVSGTDCDRVIITSRLGTVYNCIVYRYVN